MNRSNASALPIKRDIGLAGVSSLFIAVALAVVSVAGLIWSPDGRYPVGSPLVQVSQGGDAANLILGLPALLGAMWLTRRGSLIGLLLWPGALVYVLYTYALYLVGAPFDALFFGYVALVTLSAWTLTYIVASIDGDEVRRRLAVAPARGVGSALVVIAILAYVGLTGAAVSALGSPATEARMRPQTARASRRASSGSCHCRTRQVPACHRHHWDVVTATDTVPEPRLVETTHLRIAARRRRHRDGDRGRAGPVASCGRARPHRDCGA